MYLSLCGGHGLIFEPGLPVLMRPCSVDVQAPVVRVPREGARLGLDYLITNAPVIRF